MNTTTKLRAIIAAVILSIAYCLLSTDLFSQCKPYIKVDGNRIEASGENIDATGLRLPVWLKAGQTLQADQNVNSISVNEFTVNGTALDFSAVLSVASTQSAVPTGKVWKIESILKTPSTVASTGTSTFTTPGTSNFFVPACITYICVEVWGGGGAGGNASSAGGGCASFSGGGGGGGSYGYGCFAVTPATTYVVTVGAGGVGAGNTTVCPPTPAAGANGGLSSVGALISAGGGNGGGSSTGAANGAGGTFGTSTAPTNDSGTSGSAGAGNANSGAGGAGANGGGGGASSASSGIAGTAPGGGGGGAGVGGSKLGGNGGDGKVIITW